MACGGVLVCKISVATSFLVAETWMVPALCCAHLLALQTCARSKLQRLHAVGNVSASMLTFWGRHHHSNEIHCVKGGDAGTQSSNQQYDIASKKAGHGHGREVQDWRGNAMAWEEGRPFCGCFMIIHCHKMSESTPCDILCLGNTLTHNKNYFRHPLSLTNSE